MSVSTATAYGTDCKLMLLGGEANLSTTIIDSASTPKTMTCLGSNKASTTQAKFSSSSIFCPGGTSTGQMVYAADSADWNFSTGKLTIDFWAYFTSIGAEKGLISQSNTASGQDFTNCFDLRIDGGSSSNLQLLIINGGSTLINVTGAHGMSTGTWYHIALIRGWNGNANDWAVTVDGTAKITSTTSLTFPDFTSVFRIGDGCYGGNRPHDGYISNVRVVPGIAIWTANFTKPSAAYTFLADGNSTQIGRNIMRGVMRGAGIR